jgi:anti-sigma B factor antagonist
MTYARVMTVAEGSSPAPWAGRHVIVTLPEQIDVSNAGQVSKSLLGVIDRGATALIADMTATRSCDHAGADALAGAYQRTLASGTALLLVVPGPIMRHALGMTGLDRLVPIYPSLAAASAALVETPTPGPAGPANTRTDLPRRRPPLRSRSWLRGFPPDDHGVDRRA